MRDGWCRRVDIEVETAGVEVTLIDFTLSRLRSADGAGAFCDLSADPALFKGKRGDCQVSLPCITSIGVRVLHDDSQIP